MHFLGCLFMGIFVLLIFALAFIGSLIDRILVFLGLRKPRRPFGQFNTASDTDEPRWEDPESATRQKPAKPHGKIFEKDESEYVDFEEV